MATLHVVCLLAWRWTLRKRKLKDLGVSNSFLFLSSAPTSHFTPLIGKHSYGFALEVCDDCLANSPAKLFSYFRKMLSEMLHKLALTLTSTCARKRGTWSVSSSQYTAVRAWFTVSHEYFDWMTVAICIFWIADFGFRIFIFHVKKGYFILRKVCQRFGMAQTLKCFNCWTYISLSFWVCVSLYWIQIHSNLGMFMILSRLDFC